MAAGWYYQKDEKTFGPIESRELLNLASSGRLSARDLVWKQGMKGWAPASAVKGLSFSQSDILATQPGLPGEPPPLPSLTAASVPSCPEADAKSCDVDWMNTILLTLAWGVGAFPAALVAIVLFTFAPQVLVVLALLVTGALCVWVIRRRRQSVGGWKASAPRRVSRFTSGRTAAAIPPIGGLVVFFLILGGPFMLGRSPQPEGPSDQQRVGLASQKKERAPDAVKRDLAGAVLGHWRRGGQHLFLENDRYVFVDTAASAKTGAAVAARSSSGVAVSVSSYVVDRRNSDSIVVSSLSLYPVRDKERLLQTFAISRDLKLLKRAPLDGFFGTPFGKIPSDLYEPWIRVTDPDLTEAIYNMVLMVRPQFMARLSEARKSPIAESEVHWLEADASGSLLVALQKLLGGYSRDTLPSNWKDLASQVGDKCLNDFLRRHATEKRGGNIASPPQDGLAKKNGVAAGVITRRAPEDIAAKLAPKSAEQVRKLWAERNAKASASGKALQVKEPPKDLEARARAVIIEEIQKAFEGLADSSTDDEYKTAMTKGIQAATIRFLLENNPPRIF